MFVLDVLVVVRILVCVFIVDFFFNFRLLEDFNYGEVKANGLRETIKDNSNKNSVNNKELEEKAYFLINNLFL